MAWIGKFLFGWTGIGEDNKQVLLDEPWRDVVWNDSTRARLKQSLLDYKPPIDSVPQARILLVGAVGAGKSSFFNSINSVIRGNITSQAVAGEKVTTRTTEYRTYQVKAGRVGQPLSFLLCDTMGLEASEGAGVNIKDIDNILKGCIPNKHCECDPSALKDRIHCVVYVIDSSKFPVMPPQTKRKLQEIQQKFESYGMPLVVLLTKVDKACPMLEKDLKKVYHSCYIKELIHRASDCLGIPVTNVLPVKNYSSELELNLCCDILLLTAMQKMLHFADNHFDNFDEGTE
ncbi:interferon-induced protein 44-like [Brienomyrus brachyistius]|uniref:interferon-induced protein 44-like n=1 Tax=Brienomyrus brachyistius TaxID=42636 RepID=UPI0020B19D22|nr:interferon-induced protein 44-like [Brienomyrus brachyistius]